ncbi:DUF1513 domain-containing protein [Aestuariivirga sp.]|uniref:DUF1513 domain-containing protein n=1 Tax=Aestuariivirga sp. TaxID=2650926 RepID=UPI003593199F
MVIDRRQLLAGLLAGLCSGQGARAEALKQRLFISCRMDAAGAASVACFDAAGAEVFATSLPARGHDVTLRPFSAEAAVFARRPGNWFVVVSTADGRVVSVVHAPEGRHLYGHGVFSPDGNLLHVTENDIATGYGLIGIYDATSAYRRIGEFSSGGIGPHDIALLPDGQTLVVANGGLRTHPGTGRETLNPGDMKPNLALIDLRHHDLLATQELGASLRQLSIRHLAVRRDGLVAFGCQYEGSADDAPPLLGTLSASQGIALLEIDEDVMFRLKNYVGSVAFDDGGNHLLATSPRGGVGLVWDMAWGAVSRCVAVPDICGAAPLAPEEFLVTSGNAGVRRLPTDPARPLSAPAAIRWIWDNHLAVLTPD